jgi:hypothetical protein
VPKVGVPGFPALRGTVAVQRSVESGQRCPGFAG